MTDKGLQIQGVPGTWSLIPPEHPLIKTAKGIVCCPRCSRMFILTPDMGEQGDRREDRVFKIFQCDNCGLTARIILRDWDSRKLYCAAFETRDSKGNIVANKEYLHAESDEDAKRQFWGAHPQMDRWIHLVGIASVIGYFTTDKTEKKLTV
jgi:hypothetical protein